MQPSWMHARKGRYKRFGETIDRFRKEERPRARPIPNLVQHQSSCSIPNVSARCSSYTIFSFVGSQCICPRLCDTCDDLAGAQSRVARSGNSFTRSLAGVSRKLEWHRRLRRVLEIANAEFLASQARPCWLVGLVSANDRATLTSMLEACTVLDIQDVVSRFLSTVHPLVPLPP